jgi:site-specific DNA recombinase
MGEQKQFRCAVYTRKSSEDGLEQDFNSLEAQREAGEAYIRSQSHEGWKLLPDRFDDGGFSGGNMNRPGLEQLMNLVRAGKLDIIVIYKIDRLTRSLTDFARLAEVLDKHGVSFVSVTQQFNTTTSMGRLMLNVLLSFAQFEREITGERIRDKIAASKKKGMWMGGPTPMGYEVKERTLVIHEADAGIIRRIFDWYLEAGDVPALLDRLAAENVTTTKRTSSKGKFSGGKPFTRGHLYKLLSNPIYIGRIPHKAVSHPGQHPAIIDRDLWERVQAQLAANTQGSRTRRRRAKSETALLADLLCSEAGNRMIVTHATRGARRYRYYVEARSQEDTNTPFEPIRLPAVEIETAATMALRLLLGDHRQVLEQLDDLAPSQTADALQLVPRLAHGLGGPAKGAAEIFRALVTKVTYRRDRLALQISTTGFRNTLGVERPSASWPDNAGGPAESFVVTAPLLYRRRGVQAKLIIGEGTHDRPGDISLQQAVARGRVWFEQLATGKRRSVAEISAAEGITGSKVAALLELAFLAPELVDQIVQGAQQATLSTARLVRDEAIPPRWVEQRTKFSG